MIIMKFVLLTLLLISTNLFAEEAAVDASSEEAKKAEESSWKGDVQIGYVMSSGNTESTNLNGKFNIETTADEWRHLLSAIAFSSSSNKQTTAERYKLHYQAERKFTDKSYFFGNVSYEDDRFSGYDYRSTLSAGYGLRLYDENKMTLDTEYGAGYRQSQLTMDPVTGNSISESEAMLTFAAKYLWQIEEDRSLMSNLTVEAGEETTITNFELGFVTMIAGDLSLKASYSARHTNVVPAGKEKLDTITSLNLLYAF